MQNLSGLTLVGIAVLVLVIICDKAQSQNLSCYQCQNFALTQSFSKRFRFASNPSCTKPTSETSTTSCKNLNEVCGYIRGEIKGATFFGSLAGIYERRGCFSAFTSTIISTGMCREISLDAIQLVKAIPVLNFAAKSAQLTGTLCTCNGDKCAGVAMESKVPEDLKVTTELSNDNMQKMHSIVMEDMCMMVLDTEESSSNCNATDQFPDQKYETAAQTNNGATQTDNGSTQQTSVVNWIIIASAAVVMVWSSYV